MAVRYEIDVEKEVVFTFYSGVVTFDEMLGIAQARLNDHRHRPHFPMFSDFSQADALGLVFDEATALVDFYRNYAGGLPTSRVAFYVPQRNAVFGVLRQFLAMAGAEDRIRLFTGLSEARAWVGLPPA